MTGLRAKLSGYNDLLDARLRELVSCTPPCGQLYSMMAYHLGWLDEQFQPTRSSGGKRLRPALCLLACESVGASPEEAVPAALALELVHNFSLVHDDIEDSSPLRRHRSTVWSVWGIPHGINVGDGMFALSRLALARGIHDPELAIRAIEVFDQTCVELCEGQFLDLRYEEAARVNLNHYLAMARRKTAAMFGCAAQLGSLLGGANASSVTSFGRFGSVLGLGFQMLDDILGTWGVEGEIGKAASDVRDRKRALPAVLAWERAEGADLATLTDLYARSAPLADDDVEWVLDLFERLDVRGAAHLMAEETFALAGEILTESAPENEATAQLRQLMTEIARQLAPPEAVPRSGGDRAPVSFAESNPMPGWRT